MKRTIIKLPKSSKSNNAGFHNSSLSIQSSKSCDKVRVINVCIGTINGSKDWDCRGLLNELLLLITVVVTAEYPVGSEVWRVMGCEDGKSVGRLSLITAAELIGNPIIK